MSSNNFSDDLGTLFCKRLSETFFRFQTTFQLFGLSLFRYRFANKLFSIGERVFDFGKLDFAARHQRARVVEYDLDCAVGFGNEDAQRQLQGEGRVFLHQRRAGFGRAEDDDFRGLHVQTTLTRGGLVVDDGEHGHAFFFDGGFQTADGIVETVFADGGMGLIHGGTLSGIGLSGGIAAV